MKQARIEEILQQELNVKEDKGWTHYQAPEPDEVIELCRLALRATDPDMAMIPKSPTPVMVVAMADCYDPTWGYPDSSVATLWARESYQAMLAAAQEEKI